MAAIFRVLWEEWGAKVVNLLCQIVYKLRDINAIAIAVFVSVCLLGTQAHAAGKVSDVLRIIAISSQHISVRAGDISTFPLPLKGNGKIDVHVEVLNKNFDDLSVYVCDEMSFLMFQAGQGSQCQGVVRGRRSFQFDYVAQGNSKYYLVVDNSFSMLLTKKAIIEVGLTIRPSAEELAPFQKMVDYFSNETQSRFKVDEFDFAIMPCGEKNAFSMRDGGHIVMCSEMLFDLQRRNLPGAFTSVMLHELGHSLLNLIGLPNFDNEETADEFALVMLLWEGTQEMALDWIKYYKGRDVSAEANAVIQFGDRHPLSIQRVRNIERVLSDPEKVVNRWNKLLYPYLTEHYLRHIIDNPGRFHDRELAAEILSGR